MHPPRRRITDPDLATKIGRTIDRMQRFAVLWVPLLWLVGQFGFDVIGPRRAAQQLQAQVDSLRKDIQNVHRSYSTIGKQVSALVKYACFDPKTTPAFKAYTGICNPEGDKVDP